MRSNNKWIVVAAMLVIGCSNNSGGKGGSGGSAGSGGGTGGNGGSGGSGGGTGGNGDGGAPGGDMADTTALPAPMATLVGAGNASNLITDGNQHAAYLLNAAKQSSGSTALGVSGELHVATASGTDTKVATGIYAGDFLLAPAGNAIVWVNFTSSSTGAASLQWLDLTKAGATATTLEASGMGVTSVAMGLLGNNTYAPNPLSPAFSPSGNYLLVPVYASTSITTPDLHVIDLKQGKDVYTRPNGAAVYEQLILPDDTMIFQDTAGGTSTTSTPIETLYFMKLPSGTATIINTHVASFTTTVDGKTLLILKSNGDLLTWDLTARTGSGTTIASGVAVYSQGASGPIAYMGSDRSLHVCGVDGTKLLDVSSSAAGDVDGTPVLADDGKDVYYWQNVEQQESRGTLMRVPVTMGGAPTQVATKVSTADLRVTDSAVVFLQNVDDLGQLGDAAFAARDGTGVIALGSKAAVGNLRVVNPGPDTWFALHLNAGTVDSANATLDGLPNIYGALAFAGNGVMDTTLDPKAQASGYEFSDDGRDGVYIGGAAFAGGAYPGALTFFATRAPSTPISAMLSGVTELGPIVSRSLFVAAPTASKPGVYFVKY